MTGQVGAVGEVEVEAVVAVVVEEGGSSTEGFDVVVGAGKAVVVDEVDASGVSSVGEMHWRCWGVFRGTGTESAGEGEAPYLVVLNQANSMTSRVWGWASSLRCWTSWSSVLAVWAVI